MHAPAPARRAVAGAPLPPGPSLPQLAAGLVRTRGVLPLLADANVRYGDVFRLPIGRGVTFLNDPELIGPWLLDPDKRYAKGEAITNMEPAVGGGLPVVDGERWRRTRKALNPVFGAQSIGRLAPSIAGSIEHSMERWEQYARARQEIDLQRELSLMTMRTFQRTMLSSAIAEEQLPRLIELLALQARYVLGRIVTFWAPPWLPVPGQRRGEPAKQEIRSLIAAEIVKRQADPIDEPDLLNRLLELKNEEGEPLSVEELCDELSGFLIAGFDTTAAAITWSLALLATNPEAAERLRAEADAYSGDFGSGAETDAMPYATAVFSEAQRMQGFLGVLYRATEDDEIAGYHVPAGSQVGWSDYLLGRSPRLWEHPERFDPDRFLGERLACQHRYQALPFGGGRRLCIGFRLSVLQAQFALTMIAKRFHVQPAPGFRLRHRAGVSIELVGGLPATLRLRT